MYLSCKWTNPLFDFFGTGCLIFPLIFWLCARFHCRFFIFFCLSRPFALCNLSACVRYDRYNCVANNYCNIGLDYGLLVNCLFARNSNACNDYKITRRNFCSASHFLCLLLYSIRCARCSFCISVSLNSVVICRALCLACHRCDK